MASYGVSGRTQAQLEELRKEHAEKYSGEDSGPSFEERYCLAKIPNQPDEYDGPQRYCINREVYEHGDNYICPYHGGQGDTDGLSATANLQHGVSATLEHLIEDFSRKDQALYNWITESYTDAYDIDVENDPASRYDLHRLAAEIVRAERGRGHLIGEGEVNESKVIDDDGRVVLDEAGDVVTEKSEHYLAKMMHRQDKKITKLEKELGITRKEQERRDQTDDAVEAIKGFAELGSAFLERESKEYDPEAEPWDDSDGTDS